METIAPYLSGHQENDPQDFLAFLLKILHEDLNVVKEKPYGDRIIETKGREEKVRANNDHHV